MSDVVIYQAEDGKTRLEVQLEKETVWLSQSQMSELFGRERSVVTKHINNVFREGELDKQSNVQNMHIANSDKPVAFYNLDVIISVGYRVKSQRGTQFRQWATRLLREHLVKGYTLNEQRLSEEGSKLREMQRAIDLLSRTLSNKEMVDNLGKEVLQVITDYAYALATLDRYDHGTLAIEETTRETLHVIDYEQAIGIVHAMKGEFDGLFGIEKDQGFKSALGTIYQTFDGKELYPSVEEKAANLLYFVVKNHAFSDGNKRIAAAIFIYFLAGNGILYRPDGSKRLADNALVALTLLIAESRPEEKETIVKVIVNLINRSND
ncbi:Fic/DOC family protein [Geoalkalibacter ferrihydriticus]|uniref:Cytochrome C biogenesis protein CycH n=2 Tax=Geoalkalibacter ferrihydriticus TaxID=392333 RepID=A0A0C2HHN4_9BACT|nr:virulence protein RhuM/Fic/DOC family protein [Geoalkalibacter ferrihydriticus]KIH76511.1 cytochrome C biogenesis protein CycH [Geoalkalibacter ferrihydriticus DSM 17813]SDL98927.1 Fic/DOC family protein [Geoalkalibacter ferrihydriticus]